MKDRSSLVALGLLLLVGLLALGMQVGRYGPRADATPFQKAIERGDLAAVRRFLDEGASVRFRTYAGQTALGLAVALDRWPVAELLLAKGADANEAIYGMSPLKVMALSGDWDGYDWLLAHGARPDPDAERLHSRRPL